MITKIDGQVIQWEDIQGLTLSREEVETVLGSPLEIWGLYPERIRITGEHSNRIESMVNQMVQLGCPARVLIGGIDSRGIGCIERLYGYLQRMEYREITRVTLPPDGVDYGDVGPDGIHPYLETGRVYNVPSFELWAISLFWARLSEGARERVRAIRNERNWRVMAEAMGPANCKVVADRILRGDIWVTYREWEREAVRWLRTLAEVISRGEEVEEEDDSKVVRVGGISLREIERRRDTHYNVGKITRDEMEGLVIDTTATKESRKAVAKEIKDIVEGVTFPNEQKKDTTKEKERLEQIVKEQRTMGKLTAIKAYSKFQSLEIERINLMKEIGEGEGEITQRRAQQVMCFRVAYGKLVYLNREARCMEMIPVPEEVSFQKRGYLHISPLRVFGSTLMGNPRMTWWYLNKGREGGATIVMPDSHFDKMYWLWENGIFLWPQFVEAEGISALSIPGFNGGPGNMCYGNLDGSNYSRKGIANYQGVRFRDVGRYAPQPVMARMMQEILITDEGNITGDMNIYIPWNSFIERIQALRNGLKKYLDLPNDIGKMSCITTTVGKVLGMLCMYGGGQNWVALWQTPWYCRETKTWWWYRDRNEMRGEKVHTPPLLDGNIRSRIGILEYSPYGDMLLDGLEGKHAPWNVRARRIWSSALADEYGIDKMDGDYLLFSDRESTDDMKKGKAVGGIIKEKIKIIEGRTPTLTKEERAFREQAASTFSSNRGTVLPMCGWAGCINGDCNPRQTYIGRIS